VIIAIETLFLMRLLNIIEFLGTLIDKGTTYNDQFYYLHVDRMAIFLFQDLIFGYIWLFYRGEKDILSVYNEISKSFDLTTYF
jgi:hypothetical protein